MRTKILILIAIPLFFYGCKKTTYTTKPQISLLPLKGNSLVQGQIIKFELEFTDKEGDIQDTLWVQKISRTCPTTPGVQFISKNKIPNFNPTPNLKGILEISFVYNANVTGIQSIVGCTNRNDTSFFRFWMKDRAQNRSDTITSPDVILIR